MSNSTLMMILATFSSQNSMTTDPEATFLEISRPIFKNTLKKLSLNSQRTADNGPEITNSCSTPFSEKDLLWLALSNSLMKKSKRLKLLLKSKDRLLEKRRINSMKLTELFKTSAELSMIFKLTFHLLLKTQPSQELLVMLTTSS